VSNVTDPDAEVKETPTHIRVLFHWGDLVAYAVGVLPEASKPMFLCFPHSSAARVLGLKMFSMGNWKFTGIS
jgi:hypothetical protein